MLAGTRPGPEGSAVGWHTRWSSRKAAPAYHPGERQRDEGFLSPVIPRSDSDEGSLSERSPREGSLASLGMTSRRSSLSPPASRRIASEPTALSTSRGRTGP